LAYDAAGMTLRLLIECGQSPTIKHPVPLVILHCVQNDKGDRVRPPVTPSLAYKRAECEASASPAITVVRDACADVWESLEVRVLVAGLWLL
jgi:hypothetical protein